MTLDGIVQVVSLLPEGYLTSVVARSLKRTPAIDEYFVFWLSTVMSVSEFVKTNAVLAIAVTLDGIVMLTIALYPNALFPIEVTPEGISILVSAKVS